MKKIIAIAASAITVTAIIVIAVVISGNKPLKINFHSNYANHEDMIIELDQDGNLVFPSTEIDGYEFLGWFFDEAHTDPFTNEKFDALKNSNNEITIYGKWDEIITYLVTFLVDQDEYLVETIVEGLNVLKPTEPQKEGYKFIAWHDDNGEFNFSNSINNDLVLVAIFEEVTRVTVTFDLDGGIGQETLNLNAGDLLPELTNPTKEGYDFDGWLLNGSSFSEGEEVLENITLVASWQIKQFSVNLINDNTGYMYYVDYGTHINELPTPSKATYEFNGWLNNGVLFDDYITSSLTLIADFSPIYWTVTFDTEGGTPISSIEVRDGSKILDTIETTKEGYTFVNWWAQELLNHFIVNDTIVDRNLTLTAEWEPKIVITLDYNSNRLDPSLIEITEIVIDNGDNLVGKLPMLETDDGYILYWTYFDNPYIDEPVNHDLTFIAKWHYYVATKFTVTLRNSIDNSIIDEIEVDDGDEFYYPNPTMLGYTFDKWMDSGREFIMGTPITEDITIIATWFNKNFEINFINEDGLVVFQTLVQEGSTYNPTGYTINGTDGVQYTKIFVDEDMTTPVSEGVVVMEDLEYYVREEKRLTIRFYNSDGLYAELFDHQEGEPIYYELMPIKFREGNMILSHWEDVNGVELDYNYYIYEDTSFYARMVSDPIRSSYDLRVVINDESGNKVSINNKYLYVDYGEEVTVALINDEINKDYPGMYEIVEAIFLADNSSFGRTMYVPLIIIEDGLLLVTVTEIN